VSENANNFWKTVGLEDVKELKGFLSKLCAADGRERGLHTISKPNDPSIMRRTRSATFPTSIMEERSLLHSIRVSRLLFPLTTVTGPLMSFRVCLVYLRTRDLTSVLFPTPGGPTMATMTGGGTSSGVRSTRGTWRRV